MPGSPLRAGLIAAVLLSVPSAVLADEAGDARAALEAGSDHVAAWGEVNFAEVPTEWTPSGVSVAAGQEVTILGHGALLGAPPASFIWGRVGPDGLPFAIGADADTVIAQSSGPLELTVKPAGVYWTDDGSFPDDFLAADPAPAEAGALVVAWADGAEAGLEALSAATGGAFAQALDTLESKPVLPAGFEYPWQFGKSYIFEAWSDGTRTGIRGMPNANGAIVRKPVDIPLTADTEIAFDWRYTSLPALGPISEARFHDYLSIALEFDNGQDLTWLWSEHLDTGEHFPCPLPWWDERETHIVLDSGLDGLGEWRSHTRAVAADYEAAVGGTLPARITGVWFINVGAFGGHDGEAYFADVVISGGGQETAVFGPAP